MPFHLKYTFITTLLIASVRIVYKPKIHHWLTFTFDPAGLESIRVIFCKTEKTKTIFFLFPDLIALRMELNLNTLNYIIFSLRL